MPAAILPIGELSFLALLGRFRLSLGLLAAGLAYGTFGYRGLEGWGLLDSFYMTVITLSTVGFREVNPLDGSGQLFTISVVLFGLVAVLSAVGAGTELLASGALGRSVTERRARRSVRALQEHYIVCGYGRVGRAAARELGNDGAGVVVVDPAPSAAAVAEREEVAHLAGDATEEAVLIEAGIARARGLICAVDSDEVNVYVTITARALNPGLTIVARAARPESVETLRRAGADRVVSPYALSGTRMAFLSLRPSVVDFLDMVTVAPDMRLEEIVVRPGSRLVGKTIGAARAEYPQATILALKPAGEPLVAAPGDAELLASDDLVVALGPISALEEIAG
jgi:voltage-gated potassium channel